MMWGHLLLLPPLKGEMSPWKNISWIVDCYIFVFTSAPVSLRSQIIVSIAGRIDWIRGESLNLPFRSLSQSLLLSEWNDLNRLTISRSTTQTVSHFTSDSLSSVNWGRAGQRPLFPILYNSSFWLAQIIKSNQAANRRFGQITPTQNLQRFVLIRFFSIGVSLVLLRNFRLTSAAKSLVAQLWPKLLQIKLSQFTIIIKFFLPLKIPSVCCSFFSFFFSRKRRL